ncbi:uncharacterized protein LOC134747412 [Cydia strobilella]|uniref:uncharacterized protein LOC134747412 n=1 Tax=Cydia strobilella TaxID=1100964 RepID=UPI0030040F27
MEALIASQEDINKRMNKARTNYKKSPKERITVKYIEVRIETLDELWTEFLLGHKRLMENHHKEIKSSTYVQSDMYDITQELYVEFKTELKSVAETLVTDHIQEQSMQFPGTSPAVLKNNSVKLPKIVIPTFSGKYTEWTTFRDLFESLIHNNESIDNVQKMHYLKGYLSGEAEQLLRQIPISNSNYNKCWECLKQRYNNKRFMCQTILKRFLSQKNATCESANFLKELIDTSSDCLHALKNIGIDVNAWDAIVIHLLTLKLDPETRKQWELTASMQTTEETLPTFEQFKDFITNRFRALEFIETKKTVNHNPTPITYKARALHVAQGSQCPFCSESHKIIFCKQFVKQDVDSRREFVQTKGLCFNCLGGFHSAKVCQNPTPCRVCKRRHHSLLHPKNGPGASVSSDEVAEGTTNVGTMEDMEELTDSEPTDITTCFSSGDQGQVLLATAVVGAQSRNNEYYPVRAMIDPCSQASFITEATAQYLGLKRIPVRSNIFGLGGQKNATPRSRVILNLQSLIHPEERLSVKAYVLSTITTIMPAKKVVDLGSIDVTGLPLADPNYHTPNKIDVLLGAVVYSQIVSGEIRKNKEKTLVAQATSLGWIIMGATGSKQNVSNVSVFHTYLVGDDLLKKFWELESDVSMVKGHDLWTEEEKRCEEIFAASTSRDDTGRYVVKLPFADDDPGCKYGESRDVAEKRFYTLEKRLNKNPELLSQYKNVIDEYLQLGHMEKAPEKKTLLITVF